MAAKFNVISTYKIFLLAAALMLGACAKHPATTPEQGAEAQRWEAMTSMRSQTHPERIQFSMRIGEEGNLRRVTGILWGNNDKNLRMDIMAGVGAVVAKISDTPDTFLLYSPRENKAFIHKGSNKPQLKVGMPLPFNISQLAGLLNGQYGEVFGTSYSSAHMAANDMAVYELTSPPDSTLELNAAGLPTLWKQHGQKWVMDIGYDEGAKLPHSLKLSTPDGKRAIILIKNRETPAEPFTEQQMELQIPAGIPVLPLSKYNPS